MKKIVIIVMFIFCCAAMYAQSYPNFLSLRYEEDYHTLKNEPPTFYRNLKYTPLNKKNAFLSIGGEIRYQYFWFKNEDWGNVPKDDDGFLLHRLMVHTDWHLSKHFRIFAQIKSGLTGSRINASPVEENYLDPHQAFFDVKESISKTAVTIRIGRQELAYGSRRLVAVRERPNVRHAFDAARLILANGRVRNELFYAGYVASRKGIFDDKWLNKDTRFWGNYFSFASPLKFPKTDLYYFGIERQDAVADDAEGRQVRQSLGVRFYNEGAFSYDIEGVYQFGTFNAKRIKAWTASANLNHAFKKLKHVPEIGLKMDYISGDKLANDNRINTFDALFPNGSYFGLGSFVGPANLIDLHPSFRYHFSKIITANIDYDIFWRASTDDGIYGPNAMLAISGKNVDDRFIGHQLGFDFNIDPNRYVHMQVDGIYFKAGNYLKNATAGKDLLFFAFTSTLKF